MAESNLAKMTDTALLNLLAVLGTTSTTRRVRQIRAELARRGYLYDLLHHGFVTCKEWNQRYPGAYKDCAELERQRDQRRLDG